MNELINLRFDYLFVALINSQVYAELEAIVDKLATDSQRGSYTLKKITGMNRRFNILITDTDTDTANALKNMAHLSHARFFSKIQLQMHKIKIFFVKRSVSFSFSLSLYALFTIRRWQFNIQPTTITNQIELEQCHD